ncbi:hypothetical protein [Sphingomicrobium arenosum]|uniref:hypothetical protein n=1 Tax=Sphingomicrobium arenosum TaxID=2233861 RepID=UPI00223F3E0D|nr:hypothetical protein [Sphingomicrobium arenosum]
MRAAILFACLALCACSSSGMHPDLGARPAESIDPRLPVGSIDPAPGALTVADQLADLAARLDAGAALFADQLPATRNAVAVSGAEGSESWVRAQEEMGLLVRAREPVARVIGEATELATGQLARTGWASPADRAAVDDLLARASALDGEQARIIAGLEARISQAD